MFKLDNIKINKKRLIDEFFRLVKINSVSGEEDEICDYLKKRFKKLKGIVKKDKFGNLVIKIKGSGKSLTLGVHMDTVEPGRDIEPYIDGGKIKSRGKTILGADNKSPLAAVIELLEIIKENKLDNKTLEIIITREEENISNGAKNLDFNLINGKEGLILDSATPFGTITLIAPSVVRFDVEIFGRLVHVKESEKGINAIECATKIISRIPSGKVYKNTNINVAFVKGGIREGNDFVPEIRTNTVSDYVKFGGEIRGFSEKEQNLVLNKIEKICKLKTKEVGAKYKYVVKKLTIGYKLNKNDPFIKRIAECFGKINYNPKYIDSFGGSDANIFNQKNIKTVVISSAQRNAHSTKEHVIIKELIDLVKFLVKFCTNP